MSKEKIIAMPNVVTPNQPVIFTEKCNGCNHCIEVCQVDVYIPHPEKGKPPLVLHPEECWYCGCCANDCPRQAISLIGRWNSGVTGRIKRPARCIRFS